MTARRGWVGLGALIALVAVLALLARPGQPGDSPDHRSNSDGARGTSALRFYAQALGHPVGTIEGSFQLPSASGLVFVFSPARFGRGYDASQAQQLRQWVSEGGVLVYADEDGDPQLDQQLGIRRGTRMVAADAQAPAPILGGVRHVHGGDAALPLQLSPDQVPLLRGPGGDALGVTMRIGQGRAVVLSDPLPLCNGFLNRFDNGRLAADLIALAPSGGPVLFDEYHHGASAIASSSTAWVSTRWGAALVWGSATLFLGLALRGRAFGPRIPLTARSDRSTAEYASAVGALLRRSGGRRETLQVLDAATRRAVAEQIGLGRDVRSPGFLEVLAQRAAGTAAELEAAERGLSAVSTEPTMLAAARRLHALAYPPAGFPSRGRR